MNMKDLGKTTTPVLKNHKKYLEQTRVDFDPNNPIHRKDYVALENGKSAEGRYNLRSVKYRKQCVYLDMLTMMKTEIALWACKTEEAKEEDFERDRFERDLKNFSDIENN